MTYYELLEIKITATQEEIKIAYRKASKKYHPDLNKGIDPKKIIEVNKAYEILSDTSKRSSYDLTINIQSTNPYTNYHPYGSRKRERAKKNPFVGWDWGNITPDEEENPFSGTAYTNIYEDMMRSMRRESEKAQQASRERYERGFANRKPLSIQKIKEILKEEIGQKREYKDRQKELPCNFCPMLIPAGEVHFMMMGLKTMCKQCQKDIISHL